MEALHDNEYQSETLPDNPDLASFPQDTLTGALVQHTIRAKLQNLKYVKATRSRKPPKEVEVLRQKTFRFEDAHPDRADEHFLQAHRHNSQAADTTDSKCVLPFSRCTSPDRRQSGSNKRPWKPAVTSAAKTIPSDKETGILARNANSKGKLTLMGSSLATSETLAANGIESDHTRAKAAQEAVVPLVGLPSCSELKVATAKCSTSRQPGGCEAREDASTSVDWWQHEGSRNAVPVAALDDWMDYYRDPDSIEVAATARRCLALLAEQAARHPPPSTFTPKTADGIPDTHMQPGTDAQSRPGTGRSRRSCGLHESAGQETIMQVKTRQDMELRAAEETSHRFRAHHLPRSTSEPRYARILEQQAERLRAYHEQFRQVLSQLEAPFSFYQRDKEHAAAAMAAAAEREAEIVNPSFKAKPVPAFIRKRAQDFRLHRHERQALAALQLGWQASPQRRQPAPIGQLKRPPNLPHGGTQIEKNWLMRDTMDQSLTAHSMSIVNDEVRRLEGRDAKAVCREHEGLDGTSDREGQADLLARGSGKRQLPQPRREGADLQQPAGRTLVAEPEDAAYKAGKVPNFAASHASWARRLAAAKAAVQRGLTVPKASRLTEKRPRLAPAGPADDRNASCSFTGQHLVASAKSHSGSHARFHGPGPEKSCEDSFSELHSSAGIRRSASSAADLEQWFAVQARLQRKAALLIEKISLVKQGCYSMMQQIYIQD